MKKFIWCAILMGNVLFGFTLNDANLISSNTAQSHNTNVYQLVSTTDSNQLSVEPNAQYMHI